MNEPDFGKKVIERMWKCEGLFAEAKQHHGLARAKYRGRSKVQIQAYLCAIVQNLKRLLVPLYCWLFVRRMPQAPTRRPAAFKTKTTTESKRSTKLQIELFQQARTIDGMTCGVLG